VNGTEHRPPGSEDKGVDQLSDVAQYTTAGTYAVRAGQGIASGRAASRAVRVGVQGVAA
jgi:hypothetical protein